MKILGHYFTDRKNELRLLKVLHFFHEASLLSHLLWLPLIVLLLEPCCAPCPSGDPVEVTSDSVQPPSISSSVKSVFRWTVGNPKCQQHTSNREKDFRSWLKYCNYQSYPKMKTVELEQYEFSVISQRPPDKKVLVHIKVLYCTIMYVAI